MSRKGTLEKTEAAALLSLPCYAAAKPRGLEMRFESNEHDYTFLIESTKWPYPEKLSLTIPNTEKNLLGVESKIEIVKVANPSEFLVKGPDARYVRYTGELIEDLIRSATATHRLEIISVERVTGSKYYYLHLSRPQRDGRCLGTAICEDRLNLLMRTFEVKTPKELEGKHWDSVLRDPLEALSLFEMQAEHGGYGAPTNQAIVHALSHWITTGNVSEEWIRSLRGKISEEERLKLDWKKKMRGEKTEEEELKEQWQKKMRGEETAPDKSLVLPPNPLAVVDLKTRTEFLRSFGSSNTALMDTLTFLLHNAGIELEAPEKQPPAPLKLKVLVGKDAPRRYLVWTDYDIRILSEAAAKEELFGGVKEKERHRDKKERKSSLKGSKDGETKHRSRKGTHKKE